MLYALLMTESCIAKVSSPNWGLWAVRDPAVDRWAEHALSAAPHSCWRSALPALPVLWRRGPGSGGATTGKVAPPHEHADIAPRVKCVTADLGAM